VASGAELVSVNGLTVNFSTVEGKLNALDNVSLVLHRGETLGILGESGSGKSTIAHAIMGMLPENAEVQGTVVVDGELMTSAESQQRILQAQ